MIDLLVVGAGPGGLAAAARAGDLGLRTLVVDENVEAGGQYYRPPALEGVTLDARQREGRAKIEHAADAAELRLGCCVYGIDAADGWWRVWLERDGVADLVEPRAILLATGALDTPVAFPGWTLPGVVSAGAAQVLVKGQHVRPGRRAVVAGTGPFLFVVAAALRHAGVQVVEVVEATSIGRSVRHLPGSLRHPGRYAELAGYGLPLVASGIRIRRGEIVAAADGSDRLQAVRLRRRTGGDGQGAAEGEDRQRTARERVIEADLLCVGYGFSASTELARLVGCDFGWDDGLGQAVPTFDRWQATSAPGVFVAGEACGLGGAQLAAGEGELAAIGAARHLGRISHADGERIARPLRRRLRGLRSFAALLPRLFPRPRELTGLATVDTIVCRCQNVPLDAVLAAVDRFAPANVNELKTTTRCGQGWCQGRICGTILPLLVAAHRPGFDADVLFTPRAPIRPVQLAALVELERRRAASGQGLVVRQG
jgi:NADPH-dependent 2,4-dienoyl-CoA reductase/sulfur reductase-like enzyme